MADFSFEIRGRSGSILGTTDLHACEVELGGALFRRIVEDPDNLESTSGLTALANNFRINSKIDYAIKPSTCAIGMAGPYVLSNGMTLLVSIDGDTAQTITFTTEDFANIASATRDEVVTKINSVLTGGFARAVRTIFVIHPYDESQETIQVTGGTAVVSLGIDTDLHTPYTSGAEANFDWSIISTVMDDDSIAVVIIDPGFVAAGNPIPSIAAWSNILNS
jgi:hypothetical protein